MKIDIDKIKKFIIENKWIIIASIVFLAWKFILVGVLWHDRLLPPEPDDSYIYIGHIESVRQCPALFCENSIYPMEKFGGWSHLFYRMFFGYLALMLNIDSEIMYQWSFFIGSVMLLFVLIFFLRSFTEEKNLIAFSLLFLMIPNGGGSAHSFNWIVPGFFSMLLFLIVTGIILRNDLRHWKWLIPLLALVMIYTHTIGIYLCIGLIIFILIYFLLERRIDKLMLKKTALLLTSVILFYIPVTFYLAEISPSAKGNVYGPEKFIGQALNSVGDAALEGNSTQSFIPGFRQIYDNYLKWVILNPISLFILSILSFFNYKYKQTKILAFFAAIIVFLLLASTHKYGFRYLSIAWPITVIFFAFGFWYAWKWIINLKANNILTKSLQFSWILSVLVIISLGFSFSLLWTMYASQKKNYDIGEDYVQYLKENLTESDSISYHSPTVNSILIKDNLRKHVANDNQRATKFYIHLSEEDVATSYERSYLNIFIRAIADKFNISKSSRVKVRNNNNETFYDLSESIKSDFILVASFGDLKIYQNQKTIK